MLCTRRRWRGTQADSPAVLYVSLVTMCGCGAEGVWAVSSGSFGSDVAAGALDAGAGSASARRQGAAVDAAAHVRDRGPREKRPASSEKRPWGFRINARKRFRRRRDVATLQIPFTFPSNSLQIPFKTLPNSLQFPSNSLQIP